MNRSISAMRLAWLRALRLPQLAARLALDEVVVVVARVDARARAG